MIGTTNRKSIPPLNGLSETRKQKQKFEITPIFWAERPLQYLEIRSVTQWGSRELQFRSRCLKRWTFVFNERTNFERQPGINAREEPDRNVDRWSHTRLQFLLFITAEWNSFIIFVWLREIKTYHRGEITNFQVYYLRPRGELCQHCAYHSDYIVNKEHYIEKKNKLEKIAKTGTYRNKRR